MAAGRETSAETVSTFFLRSSISHFASLAAVVVLPAPCRPASSNTAGGCVARFSSRAGCARGPPPPLPYVHDARGPPARAGARRPVPPPRRVFFLCAGG